MKKLFFIAAIAGAALVSCTKNELAPSVTEQEEISFAAPVVGAQTKVNGAIGATYHTDESFDVWCVYNTTNGISEWGGTPYFNDIKAIYDSSLGGWALSPKYYWPATGYLSFVAMSPSIGNATSYDQAKGFQITEAWSQGATQDAIIDLMYSEPTFNCQKSSYDDYGDGKDDDNDSGNFKYNGVDLTFKHALSYITFQIKTAADYSTTTKFRLNTITLSGAYTTGTFNQKVTDPWTEKTDGATGTYIAYTNASGLDFNNTAVAAPSETGKETILLPQTLVAGQQKITLNYQISTDNGTTWIDQVQEADLKNATVEEWEMGKKYTYTISISMTEIILDPAVAAWDATSGGEISF